MTKIKIAISTLLMAGSLLSSCNSNSAGPKYYNNDSVVAANKREVGDALDVGHPGNKKADYNEYEILASRHNQAVQNFHVLITKKDFDEDYVFQLTRQFRSEICTMKCNVLCYDSKAAFPLIDVYPLEGSDYLKMADHLVSASTFDAPEVKEWYPYQDFHYKELGGKNWKKEPIK